MTLFLLLACAAPDPFGPVTEATTDAGLYHLSLQYEPDPPVAGEAALLVLATREADGSPVEGATVTLDATMHGMSHGLAEAPLVVEEGGGTWRATFVWPMSGAWDLLLSVEEEAGEDTVTVGCDVG